MMWHFYLLDHLDHQLLNFLMPAWLMMYSTPNATKLCSKVGAYLLDFPLQQRKHRLTDQRRLRACAWFNSREVVHVLREGQQEQRH